MAQPNLDEHPFPSANWRWKKVMLGGRPAPHVPARSKTARPASLRSRDPRQPINIVVQYQGGPEAMWVITARGRTWRRAGWLSLQDVMAEVNATIR